MIRHLLLVRHAKSSWNDAAVADRERPLALRGLAALPKMCRHLEQTRPPIDIVLCSPARRTLDTLDGIRAALPGAATVEVDEELYGVSALGLLERLRALDPATHGAMVVGHNPTMQTVGMLLAGTGADAQMAQLRAKFPTGAIATLSFDGAWAALDGDAARLVDLFLPRPPQS